MVLTPLFEAQLDLKVPDLVFMPSLEFGLGDGFFEMVESLINSVFRITTLVPRLAQHSSFPHYQVQWFQCRMCRFQPARVLQRF